jgi:hypothetical protein
MPGKQKDRNGSLFAKQYFYCTILLYITTITVTFRNRDMWLAVVNAVMNLRVPLNAREFLTSRKPVRFPRRTELRGVSKEEIKIDNRNSK